MRKCIFALCLNHSSLVLLLSGFSGADLAALVREGGLAVMNEWRVDMEARRQRLLTEGNSASDGIDEEEAEFSKISKRHFDVAFGKVRPSVSPEDRAR